MVYRQGRYVDELVVEGAKAVRRHFTGVLSWDRSRGENGQSGYELRTVEEAHLAP